MITDCFEEYDGLNADEAKHLVLIVTLPLLVRGHSVNLRVLDDVLTLKVPNMYKLQLGLPKVVVQDDTVSFFDTKIRKLIIIAPVKEEEVKIEEIPEPA